MKPEFDANGVQIYLGDCREVLRQLPAESVHCCVTSPPYWGLRDYGCDGQIGLEDSPVKYIAIMREVFAEVRRVLRSDGTLWVNMGDSYATGAGSGRSMGGDCFGKQNKVIDEESYPQCQPNRMPQLGLKPKDLVGVPWMLAFALRDDGWYLRQDIIWAKPNPMPESVTDRCTKSHEYIFLLSKSGDPTIWRAKDSGEWSHSPDLKETLADGETPRWRGCSYYYNQDAIMEPAADATYDRLAQDVQQQIGSDRVPGKTNGNMKAVGRTGANAFRGQGTHRESDTGPANRDGREMRDIGAGLTRNRRSVWEVTTQPFPEAHFATFPQELIKPCILAGCPEGGTVLDPFMGSGTTGLVARSLHSKAIGIELNPAYIEIAAKRLQQEVLEFTP